MAEIAYICYILSVARRGAKRHVGYENALKANSFVLIRDRVRCHQYTLLVRRVPTSSVSIILITYS